MSVSESFELSQTKFCLVFQQVSNTIFFQPFSHVFFLLDIDRRSGRPRLRCNGVGEAGATRPEHAGRPDLVPWESF